MEDEYELASGSESLKPLPKFGPNDLTRYFSSVATYYQSKLDKVTDLSEKTALYKKFILSTIIQLYSLTWSAADRYIDKRAQDRCLYEQITGAKQCEGIIKPVSQDTACWLCGYSIKDFPYKSFTAEWNGRDGKCSPNSPECEHVLPVAAAILFLGVPSSFADAKKRAMYYEDNYDWSHKRCNGLKSDYIFADIFMPDGITLLDSPKYNPTYVTLFLNKLYRELFISGGTTQYPVKSRKFSPPEKERWISERENAIHRKVRQLSMFITVVKFGETRSIFEEFNFNTRQLSRCVSGIFEKYTESMSESRFITVKKGVTLANLLFDQKEKLFKPIIGETTPKLCALPNAEGIIVELVGDETITGDIARDIISVCRPTGGTRKRKHSRKTRRHKWRK